MVAGTAWLYFAPPEIGGSTAYVVTHGVSMEPHFRSGDLAIVRPAAQYRVGEIVAYHSSLLHEVVLHRIYAIHDGRYTFKGDNNDFLDPVHPTRAQLVGKLWIHIAGGGGPLAYLHSPLVAAILAGGLGLLLLTGSAQKRGRRNRRQRRAAGSSPHGAPPLRTNDHETAHVFNHHAWLAGVGAIAVLLLGVVVVAFTNPVDKPVSRPLAYTQKVSFGYHATARPGPVYPSGVITTGDPIFLQLIHRLGIHIDYRLTGGSPSGLKGTDQVLLKLTAQTGWTRSIALTATRHFTGDHVSAQVSLNLPQLQAMLNEIAAQTGVPASGYTIAVTAKVHAWGSLAGHPLITSYAPALSFQLGPLQLQPASSTSTGGTSSTTGSTQAVYDPSQSGSIATSALAGNGLGVAGVSVPVSMLRLLAPIGFLIALAGALILAVLAARSPTFGESARIQSKYGHRIVPISAGADLGWPAIDVSSIKALVRLAEASGQLILHNHDGDVDTYLVNDEGSVYRYQVQLPKVVWGEWTEPATQLADATDLSDAATTLSDVAAGLTADPAGLTADASGVTADA